MPELCRKSCQSSLHGLTPCYTALIHVCFTFPNNTQVNGGLVPAVASGRQSFVFDGMAKPDGVVPHHDCIPALGQTSLSRRTTCCDWPASRLANLRVPCGSMAKIPGSSLDYVSRERKGAVAVPNNPDDLCEPKAPCFFFFLVRIGFADCTGERPME